AGLAALAPVILEAAELGDGVARGIVDQAAQELAQTAMCVARQLGLDREAVPLALAGGVLLARSSYRRRGFEGLGAVKGRPEPVTLVTEPALGAVRRSIPMSPR